MIYYAMAFYPEARPFIQQMNLKKCEEETHVQIFENEDTCLIITGVGEVQAVAAVAYLFARRPPKAQDLLVNVGICGSAWQPKGTCYLCNKIVERATGRTFYPDILLRHPFEEAATMTCPTVVRDSANETALLDMEAAGIYQAGQMFLQPHQMAFLKIVSDAADGRRLSKQQVEQLVQRHAETVIAWSKQAQACLARQQTELFSPEEEKAIEAAAAEHGLTLTQRRQMQQLLRYDKLEQGDISALLRELPERMESGKQEGKQYLEQLRQHIL
ncbi:MAG: 5'-methylthioadenosine/S-adenosylhomocysteine nucleosidase [Clostridia bacterium]|nr:5'-methylthioadenosine/S-adenosylhomocysteine nucleosidase [Clostridia bacterium]